MTGVFIIYHSYVISSAFDKECISIKRWNAGFCYNSSIQQTMLYTEEDAKLFAELIIKYGGTLYKKVRNNGKVDYLKI